MARRPPVLDLAHQLEQVHLVGKVLAGERPDLVIEWIGPNRLGYLPLLAAHSLASPTWAPRIAMMLLAVVWLASVHVMAATLGRSRATAILASTLLLGSSFYAGYFNFLVAIAGLAFWTWELRDERRQRPFLPMLGSSLAGVLLLYLAHGLALVVIGFAVATTVLLRRFRPHELAARAVAVALIAPAAVGYSGRLAGRAWQSDIQMLFAPGARLSDLDMASTLILGGLRGPVEKLVLLVLVLWIGLGIARAADERGRGVEPFLLIAAATFLAIAVFAPDKVDKTIFFAWRWGAPGFLALLLGLPEPRLRPGVATGIAAGALALQLGATTVAWRGFERHEMAGFEECLAALPRGARLVSIEWQLNSPRFRVSPCLHMGAYAAVEREAATEFSFVDYAPSLVVRRDVGEIRITGDFLIWNPRQLRPAHLAGRTHLLVHGAEPIARAYEQQTGALRVVAGRGEWHLLEIRAERLQALPGGGR
jgi:hypothetical protein